MSIWDFCIKRPVFTTVLMFAIVAVGIMGYNRMGVDLMPDFDIPVVSITTTYVGADPEVIDNDITDIIEEQVGTIEGIDNISSTSFEGYSSIVIQFNLDRNIDVAAQEVRDKVEVAKQDLPKGIDPPLVQKIDPDAQPIIYLSLTGDLPYQRLSYLADEVLKDRIQNISGVGSVSLYGFNERTIRIWLNDKMLEKYDLGPAQVMAALNAWHVELPGGRVETDARELSIKMKGEYTDVEDLSNMAVAWRNGAAVRLRDVARVEDGEADVRTFSRYNGKPSITLAVVKQSGGNTVSIAKAVKDKLPELSQFLPQGASLEITYDTSEFIANSVQGVGHDLLLGGAFTAVVIYLFLRHVRMTMISLIAIPISLVGAFGVMYFMDFTVNQITMLAMSLAVGMVIDDTIVVSENIFRHLEEGAPTPVDAAENGTREVAFAVLAATMTIAAIFLPVAFMGGIIGRVFYQFGISIGIAITLSYIVSVTMTPMLCAHWLTKEQHDNFFTRLVGNGLKWLDSTYRWGLEKALLNRFTRVSVIVFAFACLGGGLFLAQFVGNEFSPKADRSGFMISYKTPVGTSVSLSDKRSRTIYNIARKYPEVIRVLEMVGNPRTSQVNEGTLIVNTVPKSERTKTQQQIMDEMRVELQKVPGVQAFPAHFPDFGGGSSRQTDVTFTLVGPDLDTLQEITGKALAIINSDPRLCDSDSNLELTKPQISVYPRRDAAADVGITTSDITTATQLMMGGVDAAKFKVGSKRYDVRIKAEDSYRTTVESVGNIVLRTAAGQRVKLSAVADVIEGVGPNSIKRYDRMRSVTITCNITSGSGLTTGQAQDMLEAKFKEMLTAYPGYNMVTTGMSKIQRESMSYMMFALFSSIIIVYLVLAAQFESYIHPFTIMMTLPLALIGVFLALFLCHENLSIFALIGVIMLVGIVTRNGILLVEFANQLREEGLDAHHAMLKAGPLRLRPILMTAVSTIIGVVPVALGMSEGGEARSAMGVAVIGGMLTSTFLTLFIVPTAYITFDGIMARFNRLIGKISGNKTAEGTAASAAASASGSKVELKKLDEIRSGKVLQDSDDKEDR